jgi:hypothetical protein
MNDRDRRAGERPESAYEDRPAPEPPDTGGDWDGFSGPATGGSTVSPAKPSTVDDGRDESEREREGDGAARDRG